MRALGLDPVHDTRRTFDGLLAAMSRPGSVHNVPEPADYAVVVTLVDHEVTVATEDRTLRDALASQGRLHRGAPESADVVHACPTMDFDLRNCKRGSLIEPSRGATVIRRTESLDTTPANGTTVRISGPGVDGKRTLTVPLPDRELSAIAAAQAAYPRGIDVVLTDDRQVAALPRSATVEVV